MVTQWPNTPRSGLSETSLPRWGMVPSALAMPDETLATLYQRHGPSVFRRARQLLGLEADAHEVVQEVFLSLLEKPEQFQGKSSLTTFLYSATTHCCLNRIRNKKNRERLQRENLVNTHEERPSGLTPEQLLMLHRALDDMPDELAQAVMYYLVDGLTHREIAQLLSCSRRHVGNLLARLESKAWAEETPS